MVLKNVYKFLRIIGTLEHFIRHLVAYRTQTDYWNTDYHRIGTGSKHWYLYVFYYLFQCSNKIAKKT